MGIKPIAKIQNVTDKGRPTFKKSENLYPPGPYTIRFVWYPTGVLKDAEAAKQTAKIKGRESIPIWLVTAITIGVIIMAVAVLEDISVNTMVMR